MEGALEQVGGQRYDLQLVRSSELLEDRNGLFLVAARQTIADFEQDGVGGEERLPPQRGRERRGLTVVLIPPVGQGDDEERVDEGSPRHPFRRSGTDRNGWRSLRERRSRSPSADP